MASVPVCPSRGSNGSGSRRSARIAMFAPIGQPAVVESKRLRPVIRQRHRQKHLVIRQPVRPRAQKRGNDSPPYSTHRHVSECLGEGVDPPWLNDDVIVGEQQDGAVSSFNPGIASPRVSTSGRAHDTERPRRLTRRCAEDCRRRIGGAVVNDYNLGRPFGRIGGDRGKATRQ